MQVEAVVSNPGGDEFIPHDLEIDPYSQHLYWSDSQNNVINVTRLDMRGVGIIIHGSGQKPRAIALAPSLG